MPHLGPAPVCLLALRAAATSRRKARHGVGQPVIAWPSPDSQMMARQSTVAQHPARDTGGSPAQAGRPGQGHLLPARGRPVERSTTRTSPRTASAVLPGTVSRCRYSPHNRFLWRPSRSQLTVRAIHRKPVAAGHRGRAFAQRFISTCMSVTQAGGGVAAAGVLGLFVVCVAAHVISTDHAPNPPEDATDLADAPFCDLLHFLLNGLVSPRRAVQRSYRTDRGRGGHSLGGVRSGRHDGKSHHGHGRKLDQCRLHDQRTQWTPPWSRPRP
ncbi:hypothetical protein OV450_3535 [Actinobacteria bacterium OV450]|nr:hypothetical protein OV450_3535 [Actinobacteria bacterium OV450]